MFRECTRTNSNSCVWYPKLVYIVNKKGVLTNSFLSSNKEGNPVIYWQLDLYQFALIKAIKVASYSIWKSKAPSTYWGKIAQGPI